MKPTLTIDLRMWRHSGIGRYLRNVVPAIVPELAAHAQLRIVGTRALIGDALEGIPATWIETSAPIYSPAEQALPLQGAYPRGGLLWVPHYNVPLLYSGALVVTLHDIAPYTVSDTFGSLPRRAMAQLLARRAAHHARTILCASHFTAAEIQKHLGVASEKTTVTYQGIDTAWQTAPPPAPHVETDGTPYILFVGNIKPNKNLSLLLRAFSDVQHELPFRLVLAGRTEGFRTGDAGTLALAESMGARVRMAGEVSEDELRALYAGATAFCFPSRLEGFGLPLIEAMSLGCPVLASTGGSLPEIAGDAALFFSPDELPGRAELAGALRAIAAQPALRQRLREAGLARAAHFSYTRCAAQTAAVLLNELVKGPSFSSAIQTR